MIWRFLVSCLIFTVIFAKPGVDLAKRVDELELEEAEEIFDEADYHLPLNVLPQKYQISLDIDTNLWNFHGHEAIVLIVVTPTREIRFNARGLDIEWDNIVLKHLNDNESADLVPSQHTYSDETEVAILTFDQELSPESYELHIDFVGIIRSDVFGLYRSEYTIDNQQKYMVVTQFQATYARAVFPCWDNTNFRSVFEIQLNHPDRYEAYSNMKVDSRISVENNRVLTTFDPSPSMPTYLVAFALAEYQTFRSFDSVIGVHVPSNVNESSAQYFITSVRSALDIFEDYLNHPYQLPKLDFISVPRMFFGGMEHWGLITAVDRYFLNDPNTVLASPHQSMTTIITHELAHMWFGNEVTPESWNYLWLSEGMASYFELFIADRMHSNWRMMDQYLLIHVHNAMRQDDKLNVRPMTGSFYRAQDFNGQFDYVPYAKSGSVMRMIQHIIGAPMWREFLFNYISGRSFGISNPDYFHERIQEVVDKASDIPLPPDTSMARIIRSWTDNPGYPVVLVTRTTNGISLTQKRFLVDWEHTTVVPSEFYIPINTKTTSNHHVVGTQPMSWMLPGYELQIDNIPLTDYVIVNRQQTGYYRVNYGDYDWKFISDVLQNAQNLEDIHILNRAQLIDDSANLAKAGQTRYDAFFGIISYLKDEVDYIPWSAATANILNLEMMIRGIEEYPRFEYFIKTLTEKVYPTIRLTNYTNTDHISTLHTQVTANLVCFYGNEDCIQDASDLVTRMLDDSHLLGIPEQIQPIVLCSAVKHLSDTEIITRLITRINQILLLDRDNHEAILMRIIDGVGCSRNETIINSFLEFSIMHIPVEGSIFRGSDRNRIFRSVATGSYNGTKAALELILNNFLEVDNRFESITGAIRGLSMYVVTDELLDLLEQIVQVHSGRMTPSLLAAFQTEITAAKRNVAWVNHFQGRINAWLLANVKLPSGGTGSQLTAISAISLLLITFLLNRVH
ncbi:aminopeptidase N-like [Phlebotomus argentipes]|uniref:aminopeptidase N-like n=1 Tax=Phlebotomus argentipes TaxID=94469 RepID=UPI00289376A6|nr:aminopeptidase N-like [Phlebotomus argentipes]